MQADSLSGALPFRVGTFEGRGHWDNQIARGDYLVRYVITDVGDGAANHAVRREFLGADGNTLYVEETTALFTPHDHNRMEVVITGPKGSVSGRGYVFGNQCHYEADIAPRTRLEFTFTIPDGRHIHGLASSAGPERVTCWREDLAWVAPVPEAYTGPAEAGRYAGGEISE